MKYIVDNMFNWLAKELEESGIDCETAIHVIWNDDDSSKPGRWDAHIFRFLLEKKYSLVRREEANDEYCIITADNDLSRYCVEFGIACKHILQETPPSAAGNKELVTRLLAELQGGT